MELHLTMLLRNVPRRSCIALVHLVLTTLVPLIGGCTAAATLTAPPKTYAAPAAAQVGILCLLPNVLHRRYVGLTAFNNSSYRDDATEERFAELIAQTVKSTLQSGNRSAVVVEEPRSVELAVEYDESRHLGGVYRLPDTAASMADFLKQQVVVPPHFDLLLVVYRGGRGPGCPGGEPCMGYGSTGMGLIYRWTGQMEGYISLSLLLVDARSWQPIAETKINFETALHSLPWKDELSAYNRAEREQIVGSLANLIRESVPPAVASLVGSV